MARLVAVNDRGRRIGEDHPGALLSNHEVELLLTLREEGFSYGWLAAKFDIAKTTVQGICTCRRRAQTISAFRSIPA